MLIVSLALVVYVYIYEPIPRLGFPASPSDSLTPLLTVTPPSYSVNPSPPFGVLLSDLDMSSELPNHSFFPVPQVPAPQGPRPPEEPYQGSPYQGSSSKRPSPPVDPITANKRQRNNEAARKYRQKRIDRISELEAQLSEVTQERDDLRIRLARQEAEAAALRSMLQLKTGSKTDTKG